MNPSKETRNKELVQKRVTDPKTWSFGALGQFFNIHKTTAEELFKRDLKKYATATQISKYHKLLSS